MRLLKLLICLLVLTIVTNAGAQNSDRLFWQEERPLTWNDFKGKPEPRLSRSYFAMTYGSLGYRFERLGRKQFKLIIDVTFDRQDSWHVSAESTEALLSHEQRHFDLYEVYGRILMKRIVENTALEGRYFSKNVSRIFSGTFDEMKRTQVQYDEDTDHSRNKKMQLLWDIKIAEMLKEYEGYSEHELLFKIDL